MRLFRGNNDHRPQSSQQAEPEEFSNDDHHHNNPAAAADHPHRPASAAAEDQFLAQSTALIPATVHMISGCHSEETAAELSRVPPAALPHPGGRAGGACTAALLELLWQCDDAANNAISHQQLLLLLRAALQGTQIPQLSSSRPLQRETPFAIRGATKRALLVGINYRHQRGELRGCVNDCVNMKKYLMERQGFREEHILMLVDEQQPSYSSPAQQQHPQQQQQHYPTRGTIIRALRQLVRHSRPGDAVFFHYSGHGGLLEPTGNVWKRNGSKKKQYDETLYPLDHDTAGQIRDFSLFQHFVRPMPAGVRVTCVMDCCHSGSVLNLPYTYLPTPAGQIRLRQNADSLTNLAFLYLLMGGNLGQLGGANSGALFEGVTQQLQEATGSGTSSSLMEEYQGAGMPEEDLANGTDFDSGNDNSGFATDVDPAAAAEYPNDAVNDYSDGGGGGGIGDANDFEHQPAENFGGNVDSGDRQFDPQDNYYGHEEMWQQPPDYGGGGWDPGFSDFDGGGDNVDVDDVDCSFCADVLGALLEDG